MFNRHGIPRPNITVDFTGEQTLTEQSHKSECDMHNILRQYRQTGLVAHVRQYEGKYMDMPNALDFQQSMNVIAEANQMFASVPADIRKKFGNDPAQYLEFVQNPENLDALREMGLANAVEAPLETIVSEVPEPSTPPVETPAG